MDRIIMYLIEFLIFITKLENILIKRKEAKNDELNILLLGYNGGRNTGADVRVEEIVKQIKGLFPKSNINITVPSIDLKSSEGYFSSAKQVLLPMFFPFFIFRECRKHDVIIACEGSMFKSRFGDIMTIYLVEGLGLANAQNKLSVAYGGEAGYMHPYLARYVARHCKKSLIITRNTESIEILKKLKLNAMLGADTAWTFEPNNFNEAKKILIKDGWDVKKPLVIICPINPFWWPVQTSILKYLKLKLFNIGKDIHYKSIYFHDYDYAKSKKYSKYINAFAKAINHFNKDNKYEIVLVAMEKLDRKACEDLRRQLNGKTYQYASDDYKMYELVNILRQGSLLISSRFHAIVTSMPALIPSGGVTMDERIYNILADRNDLDLCVNVDDVLLEDKLIKILNSLASNQETIKKHIKKTVDHQLVLMNKMSARLYQELIKFYPQLSENKK